MDSNFCEFKSGYFLQQLASQTLVMVCFNCLFCVKKTFSASIVEQRKWKRKRYPFTASSFRFRFHKNLLLPPLPASASTSLVGRLMKEFTEAPKAVCGPKSRDRFIRARTASCQLIPRFAGLSMGMGFPWESYGKCSVGWDGTARIAIPMGQWLRNYPN